MKQITLISLVVARFRSFVGQTQINLTEEPGLKLISGQNVIEPSLGGNGCGKSSLWDGVCFALYGSSIKGLRTSDLVSYGKRDLRVELMLRVGDDYHTICRTAPPMRIYLDGRMVDQDEIDRLVGLSRARFLNSVIFGQAVPLFIDLPVPSRGDLLDEVLDLELWMKAADRASQKHTAQVAALHTLQTGIARLKGMIEAAPDPVELDQMEREWEEDRNERLTKLIERYTEVELQEIEEVNLDPIDTQEPKRKFDRQRERVLSLQTQSAALHEKNKLLTEDIEFFTDNETCSVCGQPITPEFAESHLIELQGKAKVVQAEIDVMAQQIWQGTQRAVKWEIDWQKAVRDEMDRKRKIDLAEVKQQAKQRELRGLEHQRNACQNEVNPYTQQRALALATLNMLKADLTEEEQKERDQISRLASLNYWRGGFRKVRLFCLEQVLRELILETRNSLLALGLIDWKVSFKTATETKSGTVRLGVQVDVQTPNKEQSKFDVLSGGEGQRARLAVSLGLANLVQRWAGVRFNLEVWDEPTAWLSDTGVEDLLDALRYRAESQHKSIWLLDHRALQNGGFVESYLVTKDRAGSHWQRV